MYCAGGKFAMGGRFGKYGDLKRKAALRKSRREKRRLQKKSVHKSKKQRRLERGGSK